MKPVLIIENCTSGLKINESATNVNSDRIVLGGTFTEFNVMNRNERIYTKDKFMGPLNELLARKKQLGVIYGEFDHPDVFDTSLSRVSHTLESITYVEQGNKIDGEIRLLNTYWGKEAKALVLDGCPIFVSSRAAGVTESDNTVTVKKLFTYDAVADPGFASAKVSVKVLNESLGFNENANFRIFDITDEAKINELFNMNNNEFVTKNQMTEYSEYLKGEISKINIQLNESVKKNVDPEKIVSLSEYYETLQESFSKLTKYLDYLADNLQIAVNENKELKENTSKLIEHNNYLADRLSESINYQEYLSTKVQSTIDYSEHIAEKLSKNIDYSEYIAETLQKNIDFAEYIAENTDKSIKYGEYIAEKLDKNISYGEYLAEHLDNNINYSEYLAEGLENNIEYIEYIAEHVDNNISYADYIAENVQHTQAYGKYIAESLDSTIKVIKGNKKMFEAIETDDQTQLPQGQIQDVNKYYEDDEDEMDDDEIEIDDDEQEDDDENTQSQVQTQPAQVQTQPAQVQTQPAQTQVQTQTQPAQTQVQTQPAQTQVQVELVPDMIVKIDNDKSAEVLSFDPRNKIAVVKLTDTNKVQEVHESRITILGDKLFESETQLKQNIQRLITESKKRKVSTEEPSFLLFLTERSKSIWTNFSADDKEKVMLAMKESVYTSERDVLNIMREALSTKPKEESEILISKIPTELVSIWESLNDTIKKSVLNQSKLYPGLTNSDAKMESFWYSRDLEKYSHVNESKKLITENKQIFVDNSKLTDSEIERYLKVMKKI